MQRIAVVSGGSKGIGLAIVKKLLAEGFKVFSISRSEGELKILKNMHPEDLVIVQADLSLKSEVLKSATYIIEQATYIDILVNNAGIFVPGEMHSETDDTFELQMSLNLNASYYLSKALIPLMKTTGNAYLFSICSTASIMAYSNGGSYCISKHALLGMTKVLRKELMPFGIAVSAILPGATLTDSWKGSDLPVDRFMQTDTISDALWFAWQNRANAVMEEILLRPFLGDL